jgi:hypothetical protein
MNTGKRYLKLVPIILGLILLILDRESAIEGARKGLEICIQTVIPSLFPFMFLTSLLTAALFSLKGKHSSIICRLYKIPPGTEGILLSGLLGGYPVGAKSVADAKRQLNLSATEAERMLVFCNATGPAFLFGITGSIFTSRWIPWCLWGIHLLSGLTIARLSGNNPKSVNIRSAGHAQSIPVQLRQSIKAMSEISGWIVLMRAVISVIQKRFLQYLPLSIVVFISGILELSTGCISLIQVESIGLRFVLCALFLNFGGLCVAMQTQSVSANINQHKYLSGKCLQAILGFAIAYTVQAFAFLPEEQIHCPGLFYISIILIVLCFILSRCHTKNSCGIFLESVV